jgi:PIN domain nuclease of toxin-antitoxin system
VVGGTGRGPVARSSTLKPAAALPPLHKDSFDRLLVAQASLVRLIS